MTPAQKAEFLYTNTKGAGPKGLGNTQPGDGAKYIGRGVIQLTGRELYTKANKIMKSKYGVDADIVNNPELVGTDTDIAVASSLAWWELNRGRLKKASTARDGRKIRNITNGGNHGMDRFLAAYAAYQAGNGLYSDTLNGEKVLSEDKETGVKVVETDITKEELNKINAENKKSEQQQPTGQPESATAPIGENSKTNQQQPGLSQATGNNKTEQQQTGSAPATNSQSNNSTGESISVGSAASGSPKGDEIAKNAVALNGNKKPQGKCARGVREALQKSNIKMTGWPGSAYQYHSTGYLNQLGFTNISNNLKDYTNPQKGDIIVWDRFSRPGKEDRHGHIQILGANNQWISDGAQKTIYRNSARPQPADQAHIYRLSDALSSNSKENEVPESTAEQDTTTTDNSNNNNSYNVPEAPQAPKVEEHKFADATPNSASTNATSVPTSTAQTLPAGAVSDTIMSSIDSTLKESLAVQKNMDMSLTNIAAAISAGLKISPQEQESSGGNNKNMQAKASYINNASSRPSTQWPVNRM